jgi:serine/threonine protein kinase
MGLDFLKQEKIVHMDIQPKNIIVGKGLIFKISNFEKAYYPSVSYDVMSNY